MTTVDPNCGVAHGAPAAEATGRVLVAVFASPVAEVLCRWAPELGFRTVLLDPDPARGAEVTGFAGPDGDLADADADVVVTDHHRPELGEVLRDALARPVRWVGVMGNPRHEGPHVAALAALGVPPEDVARVHRPIGLDIGSRTPPEIAVSTLAGLLADRAGRSGGFAHGTT
ncbi:XdhC family protein [Geodermatophilus sabuli]|uniref:Xanthine dehydrogenase accessory factor n=1 Tax=Geodermatophilus sabuli TaxID=1564158 RepID=A0A285EGW0_9ACTN|nr:XdhC family protein [Geodermatophilus sabuli]MBB3086009.1 xanthine dehydrogenase accessory factor [Geodermatophilus sabuli]SNX98349.1 xanthine dehydrogenase accessory factor [Geodermatophilus sabuli]